MPRFWIALSSLVIILCMAGCTRTATSPVGFALPQGDAENGRAAFVYMQCHACHEIAGEDFPKIPASEVAYIELGGEVSRVKTYAELVTSIINPSHELAEGYAAEKIAENGVSKMDNYNDFMTVRELTDIVMYLQPLYDVVVPEYKYPTYPIIYP